MYSFVALSENSEKWAIGGDLSVFARDCVRARIHFLARRPEREIFWSARSLREHPTIPGGNVSGGRNLCSTGSLFPTTCTEVSGELSRPESEASRRSVDGRNHRFHRVLWRSGPGAPRRLSGRASRAQRVRASHLSAGGDRVLA